MNTSSTAPQPSRTRRALLWGALVALLLVAQTLLVALTINYEASRAQDGTERAAAEAAGELRRELLRQMQQLQVLAFAQQESNTPGPAWRLEAALLLKPRQGLERVEWRDTKLALLDAVDSPVAPALFSQMPRQELGLELELACSEARRTAAPSFSRSYFVPLLGGYGLEVMDLCVPVQRGGREAGFTVGSFALGRVLEHVLSAAEARKHEFSIVEADRTRLARAGVSRGANVFVAQHVIDLPGTVLQMRADSAAGRPGLLPNVTTALVLGLSLALFGLVLLLARDVRRRALAERGLADALAFRNAMEDSLPTALRARDLSGALTYINPAFCEMVGFSQEELRAPATANPPPYWPPEFAAQYAQRQRLCLGGRGRSPTESREGFESVFMRKNGERFPVMIYEAPLVDADGRHTGWMSAAVDISAQRRVEEIARQQQDRLQASARLATAGEMASLLSHELNQPLAAIASYASGSLNLIATPDADTPSMLQQALTRIAEQADRAGRVIKSVHAFVRRREQQHETLNAATLFEAVMPLVTMQARKSGARIDVDLPIAPERPPVLRCDRTMVEQVLLNLSRNALQAMEATPDPASRVLSLRARQTAPRWVTFTVTDTGPGITPEVADKLFTPFFSTRAEGMGLGLSLCRTVIEQHGGALDFGPGPGGQGTAFSFTLPTPKMPEHRRGPESGETSAPDKTL